MIQIITELCIDPMTSISLEGTSNISKLYDAMVKKQKNELGQKVSNEDCDLRLKLTIWDVHKILAIILIIGNDYKDQLGYEIDQLSITRKWSKSKKKWKSDIIQRYGFVTANIDVREIQPNTINFTHRTYAEFFVAEYIVEQMLEFDEDIKDEEIQRRFKLLDVILSDRKNLEVVQQFIFSYIEMEYEEAMSSGEGCIEISENFKKLMKKKIDDIHNNLETADNNSIDGHYKCFENFAKILKFDVELSNQLWGVDLRKNILQYILPKYDKLKIQSYTGYDNNFTKVTQLIEQTSGFGNNWHEHFNINGQKLLTDEKIERFKEENDLILENERTLLKLCDFVDKNFEHDNIKMFYNIIDLYSLKNNKIIEDLLIRIAKIDEEIFKNCVSRIDYGKISSHVMKITFAEIESICGHDRIAIRQYLFNDSCGIDSPLIKAITSDNIEIFCIVRDFYIKYKDTWHEIQNILLNVDGSFLMEGLTSSINTEFKDFIKMCEL